MSTVGQGLVMYILLESFLLVKKYSLNTTGNRRIYAFGYKANFKDNNFIKLITNRRNEAQTNRKKSKNIGNTFSPTF